MSEIERANGHKPEGILHMLHPALMSAPRPKPEELDYDLEQALKSVVGLRSLVPEDAFSASYLGTEREGNAVVIGEDGLVLTIGYLISEADSITLTTHDGRAVPAHVVAYDYETGFGLLRAMTALKLPALELGSAASIAERDNVIVGAAGGIRFSIAARVISKREFAGYWEYLLDEAIFTTPPHPVWSGAALIGHDGTLVGIGSLIVQDAAAGDETVPGNMFVPIDLIKPILNDMLTKGDSMREPRAWVGMYTTEAADHLFVTGVLPDGPAAAAGIQPGDIVSTINGEDVATVADMYRAIWRTGAAGAEVDFGLLRDGTPLYISVRSADRRDRLRRHRRH